jgi:23S rRNA pseudouridine2457 synthase
MNKFIYIIFNKPYGVLSQFTPDHPGQQTLAEFNFPKDIYSVGRLDKDSEGLLLLTNDGQLKNKLLDPKFEHERTYWVQVEGTPDEKALKKLSEGVVIKGYKTKKCLVKILDKNPNVADRVPPIRERKNIPTTWIEITLIEGKNRQVRRMTAAVGFPTLRLIRVGHGKLNISDLKLGEWREIKKSDIL